MHIAGSNEQDVLEEASRLLDNVKTVEEIKAIRDKAESVRAYAQAARLGLTLQNRAAALKLRAERMAGRIIAELKLRGGDRRSMNRPSSLRLADIGVSRVESKRWQELASIPEIEFYCYLEEMDGIRRKVTTSGLLRRANKGAPKKISGPYASGEELRTRRFLRSCKTEAVVELTNHARRLVAILLPALERSDPRLVISESRSLCLLLTEISLLTRQIAGNGEMICRQTPDQTLLQLRIGPAESMGHDPVNPATGLANSITHD